jgi:hypothetical protein
VEVRLRGREAELVVTEAPVEPDEPPTATAPAATAADGGEQARLTLRMPESLKERVEHSAAADGVSVNAWLVRVVAAAVNAAANAGPTGGRFPAGPTSPPSDRGRSGRRITGFAQA